MKVRTRRPRFLIIATLLIASMFFAAASACGSEPVEPADTPEPEATVAPVSDEAAAVDPMPTEMLGGEFTFDGLGDTKGFQGISFNHGHFTTRELAGKPIVINFWFPSCPPCRAELEHFENVYQQYGEPSGGDVQFVGVQQLGLDSIADGEALFEELGITFPGLPDIDPRRFRSPTTSSRIQQRCFWTATTTNIGCGKVRSTRKI